MGSQHQLRKRQTMKYILAISVAILALMPWASGSNCLPKQCRECMAGFEGDIKGFNCSEKCQRCKYCQGFLAYLGVCKEHCQQGVKGCVGKCQRGKVICLNCQCSKA